MPSRVLVKSSGVRRFTEAAEWLSAQPGEVLIVGTTREAVDDFARRFCVKKGGRLGLHRFALGQLCSAIAARKLAERGRVILSPLGREALAARCVQLASQNGQLAYFKPVAHMPGFSRVVARTLSELRIEGVDGERLNACGPRGRDVAVLLQLYEQELRGQGLADFWYLVRLATEVTFQKGDRLVGLPLLLLDLGLATVLEEEFIRQLVRQSREVIATAPPENEEALHMFEENLGLTPQKTQSLSSGSRLGQLRRHLFATEMPIPVREDSSFEFFSAPGEGRECTEIARRILRLSKDGLRFDEMAVFLRQPELYQHQLEEAFQRSGIRGYFSRGSRRPDPAGRAFLALLNCKAEGFTASRFSEYLSLGQVPDLDEFGAPPEKEIPWVIPDDPSQLAFKTAGISRANTGSKEAVEVSEDAPVIKGSLRVPIYWERLLVEASVVGGKDRWKRRLVGLEKELELKLRRSQEDEPRVELLRRQLVGLKNLKLFSLPLLDLLDDLPQESVWRDWLVKLRRIAVSALREPETVLETFAQLDPMENVGPVCLEEVQEVLRERLSFLRGPPSIDRYGAVYVGTVDEAAAREFRTVFLPGLAEGIFPRRIFEDPLLLDEHRNHLGISGTRVERLEEERIALRVAVAAAADRLIVSYPRMDLVQGRARVPSLYALELVRAAEGRLPDMQRLQRHSGHESVSRLGWPAPADAKDAIDKSEYDLARLDPLLHAQVDDLVGQGRYLLDVNPWLARSIRSRYKRWERFWSDDDGLVAPKDKAVKGILDRRRIQSMSYSPTTLQMFAACPYRFLLYGIHRLQPREGVTAVEQMDPLIRGSLFHETQFELFRRFSKEQLLPLNKLCLERALDIADEVLDRVALNYFEDLAPAIPRVWDTEVEEIRADLRHWLRETIEEAGMWTPIHWEFAFGLPAERGRDRDSSESPARLLDGAQLKGAIDLVEIESDGQRIRVIDHKTGKAPWPSPRFVGGGEVLQPLLYALAAEQVLQRDVKEGQLYYCTHRGQFKRHRFPLSFEARSIIQQVLSTLDTFMQSAFLPAAPRDDACRYCDYRLICGPYEEVRIERKMRQPLAQLTQLREMK